MESGEKVTPKIGSSQAFPDTDKGGRCATHAAV
jgi:hypothetical protein